MMERKRWVYALYKGEEILAIGTAKEICEQANIKLSTFHFWCSKWYKKHRLNEKRRVVIRIDKDDEDV